MQLVLAGLVILSIGVTSGAEFYLASRTYNTLSTFLLVAAIAGTIIFGLGVLGVIVAVAAPFLFPEGIPMMLNLSGEVGKIVLIIVSLVALVQFIAAVVVTIAAVAKSTSVMPNSNTGAYVALVSSAIGSIPIIWFIYQGIIKPMFEKAKENNDQKGETKK